MKIKLFFKNAAIVVLTRFDEKNAFIVRSQVRGWNSIVPRDSLGLINLLFNLN